MLSKAWDRKMWRGYIIIFLTVASAKNLVTIFAPEPNCSQTPSYVYSVKENYPAFFASPQSQGKNSQTEYFSFFYSLLKHVSKQVIGKP